MTQRVYLQSGYILHYRPYRDTSLIIDILSKDYGYISAVVQGARSARSPLKGLLQPFTPLLLSWSGKTELMRLNSAEANGLAHRLSGNSLVSALYMNELLLRCLHKFVPYPNLFDFYHTTLTQLSLTESVQPVLRCFEKNLLDELGYGITWDSCAKTGKDIEGAKYYQFDPAQGLFELTSAQLAVTTKPIFSGDSLLAFASGGFLNQQHLRDAKNIMRLALLPLIGDKPLKSRELLLTRRQR